MNSLNEVKHDALIKPIPYRINLSNINDQEPGQTCSVCVVIVPDRSKLNRGIIRTSYERVDLYPDFPELKASAKTGCGLCRLIRKSIRKNWAVRPMEEWGVGPVREKDGLWDELLDARWDQKVKIHNVTFNCENWEQNIETHDGMAVTLSLEFGPATRFISLETDFQYGEISQVVSFKVFDSQDTDIREKEFRRRLPSTSSLSIQNLELISKWVNDCKSDHPTCHSAESLWLPTRLLDIGSLDGAQLPRLVETTEGKIQEPYAALSHMWGDPNQGHAPPVRTLKSNYAEMKSGIPRQMMSRNFVDAVIATRKLGLRYIWIDSLCIVQDSPDDWQREAATMYKVYKFAEIAIVATSAVSANDGFLERQLSMISAVKVDYTINAAARAAASMIICDQDASGTGTWISDIEGSPWNRRGWTLQERSVSTRMLHFCKTKLYFECRGCLKSEENEPLERYSSRIFEMWPRIEDKKYRPRDAVTESQRREGFYQKWIRAVTEYSQRRLTKNTDRLVAISVLAAEMSTSVDEIYIQYAGMWVAQLRRDLLWQGLGYPRSVPDKYLAPSWSWASHDGGIKWDAGSVETKPSNSSLPRNCFQVLNAEDLTKVSTSPMQTPLMLKLKGLLQPITFLVECNNDDRWINGSRFTFPFDIFVPAHPPQENELKASISTLSLEERQTAMKERDLVKFAEAHLDLDDKNDLTRSQASLSYLHVDHAVPSGLILESVRGAEGKWRRVGIATVFALNRDLFIDRYLSEGVQQVEVTII